MPTTKVTLAVYVEADERENLAKEAKLKGISISTLFRQAKGLDSAEASGTIPHPLSELDETIIRVARSAVVYPDLPEYIEVPARLLLDEACPRMGHRRRDCPCANCICKRDRIAKGLPIGEPLNPGTLPHVTQAWSVPTAGPLARQYAYE